jgi:hypothetical protein
MSNNNSEDFTSEDKAAISAYVAGGLPEEVWLALDAYREEVLAHRLWLSNDEVAELEYVEVDYVSVLETGLEGAWHALNEMFHLTVPYSAGIAFTLARMATDVKNTLFSLHRASRRKTFNPEIWRGRLEAQWLAGILDAQAFDELVPSIALMQQWQREYQEKFANDNAQHTEHPIISPEEDATARRLLDY